MLDTFLEKKNSGWMLRRGNAKYNLTADHFDRFLTGFFAVNHMLKRVKKKSILLLALSDERHIFTAGGYKIGMLKEGDEKQDYLDFYNSNDFAVIAGFNREMRTIEPLEIFFEHGADALMLFNSGNLHTANAMRSTFNAPCYMTNILIDRQRVRRCRAGNYHLTDKQEWEDVKGYSNLKRIIMSDELFAFGGKCECGQNHKLDGTLFYNKKHMLELKMKDGLRKVYSKFTLENYLLHDIKNIIEMRVDADEESITAKAEMYDNSDEKDVRIRIEQYFRQLIADNNISDYNIRTEIDIFE